MNACIDESDADLRESTRQLRLRTAALLDVEATEEHVDAHHASGAAYDVRLWQRLAEEGILAACLAGERTDTHRHAAASGVLLREIGSRVAPVPALPSVGVGVPTLWQHGTDEQVRWLPEIGKGTPLLSIACQEPEGGLHTRADRLGDVYVLHGSKHSVPYAAQSAYVLVPAWLDDGVGVFLVDPRESGVVPQPSASSEPLSILRLDGLRLEETALVGGTADGRAWETMCRLSLAGAAAVLAGVLEGILSGMVENGQGGAWHTEPAHDDHSPTWSLDEARRAQRALDAALPGAARPGEGDADRLWDLCAAAIEGLRTCQALHASVCTDHFCFLSRYFAWGERHSQLIVGLDLSDHLAQG